MLVPSTPLRRGVGAPNQYPLGSAANYLIHADVQLHIPVTYNNDRYLDNLAVTWDKVYLNEPCAGVPDNLCPLVLGGHGEMWGETVDASDIEQTVWPRLSVGNLLLPPAFFS